MADPYEYVTLTGVIVPDTAELRTDVENEWKAAFGDDLTVTPDTRQGVLITAETLARDGVVRNNAAVANQINPNLAGGVFLDALWALTGGARVAATFSRVEGVTLAGIPNTIIPALSQARVGPDGPIFELVSAVQLDASGNATGTFQALEPGPQAAPAGDLDTIVSGVLGWETVSNPAAGVPGVAGESDIAARRRRRQTLALQGTALPEAITSELNDVDGVRSVLFRENYTDAPLTVDGETLVANSILVVVDGGTDDDVAAALLAKKSGGCNWNGTTTVNTVEPVSGQTYPVKFTRPTLVPIYVEVTVRQSTASQLSDPAQAIRDVLLAYANGELDGESGLPTGEDVSPFELASAVNTLSPAIYVVNMEIGTTLGALSAATIPIGITQKAQLTAGNIGVIFA